MGRDDWPEKGGVSPASGRSVSRSEGRSGRRTQVKGPGPKVELEILATLPDFIDPLG